MSDARDICPKCGGMWTYHAGSRCPIMKLTKTELIESYRATISHLKNLFVNEEDSDKVLKEAWDLISTMYKKDLMKEEIKWAKKNKL